MPGGWCEKCGICDTFFGGHEDDGELAMAITADTQKKVVIIDFGKSVTWLGLPPKEVNGLINLLKKKLAELGEPCVIDI